MDDFLGDEEVIFQEFQEYEDTLIEEDFSEKLDDKQSRNISTGNILSSTLHSKDYNQSIQPNIVDQYNDENNTLSRSNRIDSSSVSYHSNIYDDAPYDGLYYKVDANSCISSLPLLSNRTHETCVLYDGTRSFLKPHESSSVSSEECRIHPLEQIRSSTMLSRPMHVIEKEADQIELQQLLKNDTNMSEIEVDSGLSYLGEPDLWVDKYSPKSFAQLLSNEKINRGVLKALKQWDSYVFKKDVVTGSSVPNISYNESSGAAEVEGEAGKTVSSDRRPQQKIILLSGSPGTGKTTLAHVIARHCGYRPIEVNSSDDRSADSLRDVLSRAMQTNTIYGDGCPTCLVLDEIDGVDGRAPIDMLISLIKTPLSRKKSGGRRKDDSPVFPITRPIICICNDLFAPALRDLRPFAAVFSLTTTSEQRLMQRLRYICSTESFPVGPGPLAMLCKATGGDIRSCLNTLQFAAHKYRATEKSSTSNTSVTDRTSVAPVSKAAVVLTTMLANGLKDEAKDVFQLWKEILSGKEASIAYSKRKSSHTTTASGGTTTSSGAGAGRLPYFESLMQSVVEFGDMPLVVSGVFENRGKIRYSDSNFVKTQRVSESLSYADVLDGFTRKHDGGYQVVNYIPASILPVHIICSSDSLAHVSWPSKGRQVHLKTQQRESTLQSVRHNDTGFGGRTRCSLLSSAEIIAIDAVSYIIDLITPMAMRSTNFLTMSPGEKDSIRRAVATLSTCGLNYVSTTIPMDGANSYPQAPTLELDPAIHRLVAYTMPPVPSLTWGSGQDAPPLQLALPDRHVTLSVDVLRVVKSELVKHLIASKASSGPDDNEPKCVSPQEKTPLSHIVAKRPQETPSTTLKPLSVMDMMAIDKEAIQRDSGVLAKTSVSKIDFFCKSKNGLTKREREDDPTNSKSAMTSATGRTFLSSGPSNIPITKKPRIFFKFKQGSSNAVRRTVPITEFL